MIMNAEDARISPFPKGTENAKTGETPTLDLQGPRATSWKEIIKIREKINKLEKKKKKMKVRTVFQKEKTKLLSL